MFVRTSTVTLTAPPSALAAGDLDGDGIDDVAVKLGETLNVLLSNGQGAFVAQPPIVFSSCGLCWEFVGIADLDGDGVRDIAVRESVTVRLFLGEGDGTFEIGRSYATDGPTRGATLLDVDGDGDTDIAVTNPERASILLNRCR